MPQKKETEDYAKKRAAYNYRKQGTKEQEKDRDFARREEDIEAEAADKDRRRVVPRRTPKAGTKMEPKKAEKVAMYQRKAVNEADPDTDWSDSGQKKRWEGKSHTEKLIDEYGKGVANLRRLYKERDQTIEELKKSAARKRAREGK